MRRTGGTSPRAGLAAAARAAYTKSRECRRALADYEALLTEVLDPLVRKGYVRWATPSRMHRAYEARERK